MSLPWRTTDATGPDDPTVVGLDDDGVDDLVDALGSETARDILAALQDDPRPAADLASAVGTSVQNVHYHLERMEAAGVVEPVDTVYSEKGREMTVYGPTASPLVLVAGGDGAAEELKDLVARTLGALGAVALAAVAVQRLLVGPTRPLPGTDAQYAVRPTQSEPALGLAVFLVGLVAVAAWAALRYRRLA